MTRLRSASNELYKVPRTRLKFAERGFSVAGPAAWNDLPVAIRQLTSTALYSGDSSKRSSTTVPVACLDHNRCSKWRPFALTHVRSCVFHWWCPEEYGPKCQCFSSSMSRFSFYRALNVDIANLSIRPSVCPSDRPCIRNAPVLDENGLT